MELIKQESGKIDFTDANNPSRKTPDPQPLRLQGTDKSLEINQDTRLFAH
jgi:hypothetical protein